MKDTSGGLLEARKAAELDPGDVDAAILRRRAGIEKRQLQEAFARRNIRKWNSNNAPSALAGQRNRGNRTIIDQHFQAALHGVLDRRVGRAGGSA